MCAALWVLVFFIDFPNFVGWGAHTYDFKTMGCTFDRLASFSYVIFMSTAMYWIPLSILSISYVKILMYVKKQRSEINEIFSKMSETPNKQLRVQRKREDVKLVRTFFIIVIVFLVCWTPYFALVLFDSGDIGHTWIYVVLLCVGHANSSINSALYASTSRFRNGYKTFLCILCRNKHSDRNRSTVRYATHESSSTITIQTISKGSPETLKR